MLLFNRKRIELSIENVLPFGQTQLVFIQFFACGVEFAIDFLAIFELLLAGGEFDFLCAVFRFAPCVFTERFRLAVPRARMLRAEYSKNPNTSPPPRTKPMRIPVQTMTTLVSHPP